MDKEQAVAEDMGESNDRVMRAKPIILDLLKGDDLLPVECEDNKVLQMLDRTCGIDYYHVFEKYGFAWGIGSRVQPIDPGTKPWNTFTVRLDRESGAMTEYQKRKRAIERGGTYPYLTLQLYVSSLDDGVLSLGIARTQDIIEFIDRGLAFKQHTRCDKIGQASFYVVRWEAMVGYGYKVLTYEKGEK